MDRLRLVLVDDHALVREGLKRLVDEQADMEVVGEAGDGPEAVRVCEAMRPDVALLDLSMPTWDGVKTTLALRAACPHTRVVAVTRHDDAAFVRRVLGAGASGYVLKQGAAAHLITAIRVVAGGETFLDPSHTSDSLRVPEVQQPPSEGVPATPLSAPEERVLRLAAAAFATDEIAQAIGVDAAAVAQSRADGMAKLGLRTRVQLIVYAREHGWLKPSQQANDSAREGSDPPSAKARRVRRRGRSASG